MGSLAVLQQVAGQPAPPAAGSSTPSTTGSLDVLKNVEQHPDAAFGSAAPPADNSAVAQAMADEGVSDYKPGQGIPFGHYGVGMRTGDITPSQAEHGAEGIGAVALPGVLGEVGNLLHGAGEAAPRATQALKLVTQWAKTNPFKAYALMAIVNRGLSAAGLSKASKIADNMEPWALLLLGDKAGTESGAVEKEVESEAAQAAGAAPEETAAPAPKETPEQFVDRMAPNGRAQVKPNSAGQVVDATTGEPVKQESADVDLRTPEEKQASVDRYYAAHPEKRPQPKVVQRGPKKGQLKTVRVFDAGKWHEVPVYK